MFFQDHKYIVANSIQTLRQQAKDDFDKNDWIPVGSIVAVIDPSHNKSEYILQLAKFDPYHLFGVDFSKVQEYPEQDISPKGLFE